MIMFLFKEMYETQGDPISQLMEKEQQDQSFSSPLSLSHSFVLFTLLSQKI